MVISHRMHGLTFSLFSSEEIKKLSVKEITNPNSFDMFSHPTAGGLYDAALGKTSCENPTQITHTRANFNTLNF